MRVRLYVDRRYADHSPVGVFSNLWPTRTNREDREATRCGYVIIHALVVIVSVYFRIGR